MHELGFDGSYQRIDNRENSQFHNQTKLTQDYMGLAFYTFCEYISCKGMDRVLSAKLVNINMWKGIMVLWDEGDVEYVIQF